MSIIALIKRELQSQFRRKKTLVLLLLMCGFILMFISRIWPHTESVSWSTIGFQAKGYMSLVLGVYFAGAVLFIPGIAAPGLVIERETRTWDMLGLSLIGPWGIIVGKLASTLSIYLMMLIGLLPFLAIIFFLVGIDFSQVFICLYVLLLTMVTFASLGIFASAYNRTSTRAISRSYVLTALNMGFGYMLFYLFYMMFIMLTSPNINNLPNIIGGGSPAYSTLSMIGLSLANLHQPMFAGTDYLLKHTLMQVTTIVIALVLTWMRVRRPVKPLVAKKKKGSGQSIVAGEPLPLPPGFKPIPTRMNPILFREIHWGIDIKKRVFIFFGLIMVLASGSFAYAHHKIDLEVQVILNTVIGINIGIISLFMVSNFSNIFTKEDELKNLDMLKMTLITPKKITWGKVRAGIRVVNRLVVLSLCINIWFIVPGLFDHTVGYRNPSYWDSVYCIVAGHGTIWVCGVLCVQVAAFSSTMCKKTTTAVVSSYAMMGMIYFGNSMFIGIFFSGLFILGGFPEELFVFTSPLYGFFIIPEINDYENIPYLVWSIHSLLYCFLAFLFYQMAEVRYVASRYSQSIQEG